MTARLILLVLVAGTLAVTFALKARRPVQSSATVSEDEPFDAGGKSRKVVDETKQTLSKRPLPGREPPDEPDLRVRVYPDPGQKGKKRLRLEITESHGYYVESFSILAWHKDAPDTTPDESKLRVPKVIDKYLKANDTLVDCMEIVPIEMSHIKHDLGTEANWEAEVVWHGRARETDPNPLPKLADSYSCD